MKVFDNLQEEDRFGLYMAGGIHGVLLVFFLLYSFSTSQQVRPSFVNVQLGQYKQGMAAEFSEEVQEEVATNPNPSEEEPEEPVQDQPEPVEKEASTTEETTKPVDAPDQEQAPPEDVEIKTPETDKVEPENQPETQQEQETVVPPKAQQAAIQQEGAETSGDVKGTEGEVNADQGTGNEKEKSAPFNLNIEGINRDPLMKPLPNNEAGVEATITLNFEVTPSGEVVNIFPVRKSGNPAIDQQVVNKLRDWQFNSLPEGAPKQNQSGTI